MHNPRDNYHKILAYSSNLAQAQHTLVVTKASTTEGTSSTATVITTASQAQTLSTKAAPATTFTSSTTKSTVTTQNTLTANAPTQGTTIVRVLGDSTAPSKLRNDDCKLSVHCGCVKRR